MMSDEEKNRRHLLKEVRELRLRVAELETAEVERNRPGELVQQYFDLAGVFLVMIEADQKISFINQEGCRILETRKEDILGSNWFDIYIPERERAQVKAGFIQSIAGEIEPVEYFENWIVTATGRERLIAWHNTLLQDECGHILGILSSGEDITERKRQEEDINASNSFLKSIMEQSPFAMWISDTTGTVLRTNRTLRDTLNMTDEQIVGRYNVLLDDNLHGQGVMTQVRAVFEEQRPARFSIPWFGDRTGDVDFSGARDLWLDVSMFPIVDKRGHLTNVVCQWIDITKRKQMEDEIRQLTTELEQRVQQRTRQLESANKELEAFTYSVSHDLRAPLRGIDGFSLALLEDFADQLPPEAQHYLHRVRSAAQHMGHLTDDLLRLSRLSRTELRRIQVDLSLMVEEIVAELSSTQPNRETEFIIVPDLVVTADQNLMRLVLENVLQNAWKFSAPRAITRIELGCRQDESEMVYFIRDHGVGFDMCYAHKLFDAFQRLHDPKVFKGTGIGLAIVQRIVRRHGGRIWAESAVEQGTTIYFTLPAEKEERCEK